MTVAAENNSESAARALRAIQVVSGLEIAHGGPSYSVPRLNEALVAAGIEGRIYADLTPGELANNAADSVVTFDRRFGTVPLLRKLHISGAMYRRLLDDGGEIDIIHSHGLWRMPNIYAARAARRHGIPHVIAPRGMLSRVALDFSRTSKALFWFLCQRTAIEQCACVHATSMSEYREVRNLGIRCPIAVIPNGIDMPKPRSIHRLRRAQGAPRERTLLYIGRIHPKKGINSLVRAWAAVAPGFVDWRLRIIGPGEERHLRELDSVAAAVPRLSIEAPIYGEAKWRAFADADLFILPSYNENFGITVAESLACGRPVITTKGTPWRSVETEKCGWWIDSGPESIEAAMRVALGTPAEVLDEMGERGAVWINRAFSWTRIGEEMARVYRWLRWGAPRPDCTTLD